MLLKIILAIFVFAIIIIAAIYTGSRVVESNLQKDLDYMYSLTEDISDRVYREEQIEGLPEPVKRYFRYALRDGQPYISSVELKHSGKFKTAPGRNWMSIEGREYFTTQKPGFVWLGKVPLFTAKDKYINGKGRLTVKILSLLKIVDSHSEEMNQGELLRWLGEAPWYPTALLPSEKITWEGIDSSSAKVTLSDGDISVDGTFHFNEKGQIVQFNAIRYYNDSPEDWSGYYRSYKEINGVKVPVEVEVTWNLESGDYSYAKFNVDTILYNKRIKIE